MSPAEKSLARLAAYKKKQAEKTRAKQKARPQRIERIADKKTELHLSRRDKEKNRKRLVFTRQKAPQKPRIVRIVAYDLETTRIKKGTPRPLYLTAYNGGEKQSFWFSGALKNVKQLGEFLLSNFLTKENSGTRFVAWNGNNYDVFFISAAMLNVPGYILFPYLTKGHQLRGMRIVKADDETQSWEFLDGCAMLGMTGRKLSWFLKTYAPEYLKLDAPDWETEEFDATNRKHVEYAERDSVGLWHGIEAARGTVLDTFHVDLAPTIGNTAIKIFSHHIPFGTTIREPKKEVTDIIRDVVMRGGYCEYSRKYQGPAWKYDLNQAYAASMRESPLPSGDCYRIKRYSDIPKCAIWRVTATHDSNIIPFYYKETKSMQAKFTERNIRDTWITSIEYKQLEAEGWKLRVTDGYWWSDSFTMKEYVDKLEKLRTTSEHGPTGALGVLVKYIGNNSYGKTVSRLNGMEMVLANERPAGYHDYQDPNDKIQHLWFKFAEPGLRAYHQPQIGTFITAYVRMQVRRAALQAPDAWLYADTDCVMFNRPVDLDIDPLRYGAWKVESNGDLYRVIGKKIYFKEDGSEIHAKGMNIKRLTVPEHMIPWYDGKPPQQTQVQKNNILTVMTGEEMFFERVRRGTNVENLKLNTT